MRASQKPSFTALSFSLLPRGGGDCGRVSIFIPHIIHLVVFSHAQTQDDDDDDDDDDDAEFEFDSKHIVRRHQCPRVWFVFVSRFFSFPHLLRKRLPSYMAGGWPTYLGSTSAGSLGILRHECSLHSLAENECVGTLATSSRGCAPSCALLFRDPYLFSLQSSTGI